MNQTSQVSQAEASATSGWSRYQAARFDWMRKADADFIQRVLRDKGVDISDHRPEALLSIDRSLGPRFRELARRTRADHEGSTIAIGCYLGEVFVHNLG